MMFRIWIVCVTALVGAHAFGDDGITYLDEPLPRNSFVRPRVVDVETGRLFVGRPERRDILVLSPNGNGREIPVGGHSAAIGIGYIDGSKVMIVSCRSALVLIFNAETLDLKRRFIPTATASAVSLATSKGSSFAAFYHDRFGNQYNTWPIWQLLDTKKQLTTPRIGGTAAVSHDGRHLFAFAASRSYPNQAPRLHKLPAEHLNWESENELLRALAEKSSAFATVEVPKKQPGSAKREPARIVVDPAGNYVSVDENIFDADTLGHIGTLSTRVGAFVPNKPVAATIASRALRFEKIGSTADGAKPIARQPLGPEWFPTYERAGNNAAISIGGGFAVVHNGDRAKFFPLDAFELPGTPLLRLKVAPPKRLFVEQPSQFPVETEPGTQVEVLEAPEGFTLENGAAKWTPSLKQLGQHSVKVRLRNGDEEAERTFQLAVSHPILPGSDMRGFVRSGPFGRRFVAADTMRGGEVVLLTRDGKELLRTRARISRSDRERAPGDLILGPDALWIFPGGGRAATRYPIADDNSVGQPQQVVFRAAHGSSWRRGAGTE